MIVINRNELHYGLSQSDHLFYYALIADFSAGAEPFPGCARDEIHHADHPEPADLREPNQRG